VTFLNITPPPFGVNGKRVLRRLHGGISNAPAYQLWLWGRISARCFRSRAGGSLIKTSPDTGETYFDIKTPECPIGNLLAIFGTFSMR
jgi:hypothetical protein